MSTLERLVDDFQSESGITLDWIEDSEQMEDERMGGSNPDDITYTTIKWEERFAVVKGFSFEVAGAKVSGRLPYTTLGRVDADSDEVYDDDAKPLLDVIRKVCGPINFGETGLA